MGEEEQCREVLYGSVRMRRLSSDEREAARQELLNHIQEWALQYRLSEKQLTALKMHLGFCGGRQYTFREIGKSFAEIFGEGISDQGARGDFQRGVQNLKKASNIPKNVLQYLETIHIKQSR